jgi:RHS repeat-associated protein
MSVSPFTPTTPDWFDSSNRLTNPALGIVYDNSQPGPGNLTAIGGYSFEYDAENRQTKATINGISTNYQYDGTGRRVQKSQGAQTITFVYDAQGVSAAEYAAQAESAACTTCYLSADHLGSTRMVTDAQGQVVSRHDYLPFGEEIPAGNGGRTAQWGATDGVTQKFTGQERDLETDVEFLHARYFSAAQQRFLSPDPMNAGVDLFNPKSWNAYAYVNNSPLSNTDPSGLGSMGVIFNPFRSEPNSSASSGGASGRSGGGFTFWQNRNTPPAVSTIGPANRLAPNTAHLPQNNGTTFTKIFLPPNANICFDNQNYFYAPPTFDITKIEAAGRAGGWSPQAMNAAVGHYGTFDFQRSRDSAGNTTFYSGYTPVSNFSVGAYVYSAGFSKSVGSFIANTFALFKSSNAGDPAQATYRNLGYDTAARGQVPVCQAR